MSERIFRFEFVFSGDGTEWSGAQFQGQIRKMRISFNPLAGQPNPQRAAFIVNTNSGSYSCNCFNLFEIDFEPEIHSIRAVAAVYNGVPLHAPCKFYLWVKE